MFVLLFITLFSLLLVCQCYPPTCVDSFVFQGRVTRYKGHSTPGARTQCATSCKLKAPRKRCGAPCRRISKKMSMAVSWPQTPPSNHTNKPRQGSQRSQGRSSISLFSLTYSNQSSLSVFSPYLSVWVHSTYVPSQLSRRSGRPLSFRLACVSAWKYRQLWQACYGSDILADPRCVD